MARSFTVATVALVTYLVLVIATSSAQAQRRVLGLDDVQRLMTAVRPDADTEGGIVINENLRVYGGLAIGGGHDSNIDDRTEKVDGGAYGRVDAGVAFVRGPATNQTVLLARGSYSRHDIQFRPYRYDGGILLDHHVALAQDIVLTLGGFYYRDEINLDSFQSLAGYFQLKRSNEQTQAFLRGRVYHQHYLLGVGGPAMNFTFTDLDDSFDYVRTEQSAGILVMRARRLAPYGEVGYANMNYTNEINPQVLSRDGNDIWVVAGVRVTFSNALHLDLGGRFNNRWTDDPRIDRYSRGFFDGKLVWTPSDRFSLELAIDRKIVEPFEANAVLADRTSYHGTVTVDPNEKLTISTEAGYNRLLQVGSTSEYDEFYVGAESTYKLARGSALYSTLTATRSRNRVSSETDQRLRIEAGIKVTF